MFAVVDTSLVTDSLTSASATGQPSDTTVTVSMQSLSTRVTALIATTATVAVTVAASVEAVARERAVRKDFQSGGSDHVAARQDGPNVGEGNAHLLLLINSRR